MDNYPELSADLNLILATENGRRFIFNFLESVGAERQDFCTDGVANAYWQGRRSAGYELLCCIRALPDGIYTEALMRKEARARPVKERSADDDIYRNAY